MGSEMVKGKTLIEKVWWMIPPMVVALFILFGMPLIFTVLEHLYNPSFLFFQLYALSIASFLIFLPTFLGKIFILVTVIFMGVGYYVSRKKTVIMRISVPIVISIISYCILIVLYLIVQIILYPPIALPAPT